MNRDVNLATSLTLAWLLVVIGVYLILTSLLPAMDPMVAALWVTAVLCIVVAIGLSVMRWWGDVGFTAPRDWREPRLLILPAVITLLPLAAGIAPIAPAQLGLLTLGYMLTGFAEEAMFRGVLLRLLGTGRSAIGAAAIASVLFGLAHLGNVLIRGDALVVAAQAVGAACFGFGYCAVRLRTGSLWPLILTHFLTDLFLQLGNLPLIPVAAVQDVILLGYGIFLLRTSAKTASP